MISQYFCANLKQLSDNESKNNPSKILRQSEEI